MRFLFCLFDFVPLYEDFKDCNDCRVVSTLPIMQRDNGHLPYSTGTQGNISIHIPIFGYRPTSRKVTADLLTLPTQSADGAGETDSVNQCERALLPPSCGA